jgi:ferredoxin/flavodoxin
LNESEFKIALVYFSATKNTEKIKNVIKEEIIQLKNDVEEFNLADRNVRESLRDFESFNAVIFGFPVYFWRAPRLVREWLKTINGTNLRCSLFFTYGGVDVGVAHQNLKRILDTKGFKLVASAEFLGKHTYNVAGFQFMEDRPHDEDFKIAREFASISLQKFLEEDFNTVIFGPPTKSEEEVDKIELSFRRAIPTPYIDANLCIECGVCQKVCPTNAMDFKKGKARSKDCIRCLRCLSNCPENAIKMPNMIYHYELLKNTLRLTEDILKNRKSRIFC